MNYTIEKPLIRNFNGINHVVTDLQTRGFFYLFKLRGECISYKNYSMAFEEFDILEVHSIKTSSSAENYVLYGIKSDKFNIKGIVINSFDTYANNFFINCIHKIVNYEQVRFEYYKADSVSEPVPKTELAMSDGLPDLLLMQHLS